MNSNKYLRKLLTDISYEYRRTPKILNKIPVQIQQHIPSGIYPRNATVVQKCQNQHNTSYEQNKSQNYQWMKKKH